VSGLWAQSVLTWHVDTARTGQNLAETLLTPANVNYTNFGLLFPPIATDGKIDAQPLYVPSIAGHNVLYVASENDTVYALDADAGTVLWSKSILLTGETASDDRGCSQVTPTIGITSTPVIDLSSGPDGTIYLVAMTKDSSNNYHQRLHALDLVTGAEEFGGPTEIEATYPSTGPQSSNGVVTFNPAQYKERAGLLLSNGVIYTSWASHCDIDPYSAWIIGYSESTLAQVSVIDLTPNGEKGAIWQAGAGPAADAGGNLYFLMANGTFDTSLNASGFPTQGDYGNAFMKLSTNPSLAAADYFTMDNTVTESNNDTDLGSGGAMLLPILNDAQGNPHELAVGAGKDGNAYVVDRNNMGKYNGSSNAVYQQLALGSAVFSSPAWFNNTLYYAPTNSVLSAYTFSDGSFNTTPVAQSVHQFGFRGATPSISANGATNGIVWVADTGSPAVLYAYNASNLTELYDSTQAPSSRDSFGAGITFATPTVANGKVYVGTTTGVAVFGLLNCTYNLSVSVSSPTTGSVTVTTSAPGCSWSVANESNFITVTSGQSGTGSGTVALNVAPNPGATRTGLLVIAGQLIGITQSGANTLVPAPSNPTPANGATQVSLTTALSWTGTTGATSYDVYFGTSPTPTLLGNTASTSYPAPALTAGITYYWMVVAKNSSGTNSSSVWSFTTSNARVAPVSVTPNSGSGSSQTFALVYSDTAGAASLQFAYAWFNATLANSAGSSCFVNYDNAVNQINLMNDAGTAWLTATLGAATTLQNSQCSVNVAATSVAKSGNTLTLNLAMTFLPGYAGAKNTYMYGADIAGANSGWQQLGTWTVPAVSGTPATVSVTPNSGSGASQTFALVYSDTGGAASLQVTYAWFNATLASSAASSCFVNYSSGVNQINLLNDAGTAWTAATPGAATTLQNSQCSVNVASTSVVKSGNTLTLNLAMTFQSGYAGAKNTYMYAADISGANSGWQQMGTWTAQSVSGTPATVSVTPNSGSGSSQTFALVYSDTGGAASLQSTYAWFNATLASSASSSCFVNYSSGVNQINLLNDAGTAWLTATPGVATTLANSQCSVNVAATSVAKSGNTLTLNLAMTFQPGYAGAKNTYMYAADVSGSNSGWQQEGTWTAQSVSGTPATVSVTPNSGSGASQTFALVYSDTAGAASLQSTYAWFNATLAGSAASSCFVNYDNAANQVSLLNDAATAWLTATPGAATTLQNSQCSVNVASTSAAKSGNTLTLNLAMTFLPSYAGAKNTYMYAADVSGANSGWQQEGTWTAPSGTGTPAAVSVTPNSGSGASQTFALVYSDTAGAASLQVTYAWFNATLADSAGSSCFVNYDNGANQINLMNDAGTAWLTATPGAATTLENSQCSVNVASTSVAKSGNTLTLTLAMTFQSGYAGAKNTYMYAADVSGANSGWQQLGAWTVP
jgi:hypothetical protein